MSSTTTAGASGTGSSGADVVTTDSSGSTVTVFSGLVGQTSTGNSAGASVRNVRVWALGLGQTFGTIGLMGAAALGFAVLL